MSDDSEQEADLPVPAREGKLPAKAEYYRPTRARELRQSARELRQTENHVWRRADRLVGLAVGSFGLALLCAVIGWCGLFTYQPIYWLLGAAAVSSIAVGACLFAGDFLRRRALNADAAAKRLEEEHAARYGPRPPSIPPDGPTARQGQWIASQARRSWRRKRRRRGWTWELVRRYREALGQYEQTDGAGHGRN